MALKLRIESKDAESARALQAVIRSGVKLIAKQREVREMLPKFAELSERLIPKPAGNGLELTLADKQIGALITDVVTPVLVQARKQARRTVAMAHLKTIGTAVYMYAEDNEGRFPDSLGAVAKADYLSAKVLKNPRVPKRSPGFVYVRPAKTMNALDRSAERVMAYEAHDDWPSGGIAVLYADGHVGIAADEARFKKRLAASFEAAGEKE